MRDLHFGGVVTLFHCKIPKKVEGRVTCVELTYIGRKFKSGWSEYSDRNFLGKNVGRGAIS